MKFNKPCPRCETGVRHKKTVPYCQACWNAYHRDYLDSPVKGERIYTPGRTRAQYYVDNRDKLLRRAIEFNRGYYKANKAKVLASQKAYYQRNRDKCLAAQKQWRDAHKEQCSAKAKARYYANLEANRALRRKYWRAHKDKYLAAGLAYRQRDRAHYNKLRRERYKRINK